VLAIPDTLFAGQKLTTDWTDDVEADISTIAGIDAFFSASTSYVPVWSSSGTAVSLGNGTATGHYLSVGKWTWVHAIITMGSTTTFGSGVYRLSLPVDPAYIDQILPILCFDSSASLRWGGQSHIVLASASGDNMRMAGQDGTANVGPANPFTWAQSDKLILQGWYETI
jgi:hypothetical protein